MRAYPFFVSLLLAASAARGQNQEKPAPRPHVVVIGVNGMELDVIRPLILKGAMPNLERVINNGAYGKLRTVSAPNCPRVYSTIFTSTDPDEHGVTGFLVGGITANTNMLKEEPIWSVLSRNDVTVGMDNVPATFPMMPVNGYMISGMLTRGKNCEDDFTMLGQSCEDHTGHWLYPIAPYNVGYNISINSVRVEAFPDQYIAFDKVLGSILKHVDENTYMIIISDHGIKPLREFEDKDPHAHMNHEKTTPVIAKHDFADGDDVPGSFFAMGPGIKHGLRLMGFEASVYDIAPTILHIYGVEPPKQMRGHLLDEIFEISGNQAAQK